MVLLGLALLATLGVLALSLLRLDEARTEIEEQRELIDKKETFSAAMQELVAKASELDGVLFGSIVPHSAHVSLANRGWDHRWNSDALDRDTADVRKATEQLETVLAGARDQAATNATGTTYEAVIDQLGGGYVATAIDDADGLCETDVLGCVISSDPYTVHFDAKDTSLPYMTDWLRTGLAYHEFAHVLQMTNPAATNTAVEAFGGDSETMADCFALTYLDGWTLDHTIWVSDFEYWEVSMGYGYTCDETQRQAVRDWYGELGFHAEPIAQ